MIIRDNVIVKKSNINTVPFSGGCEKSIKQIQINVPRHLMFVFLYMSHHETSKLNKLSTQSSKPLS